MFAFEVGGNKEKYVDILDLIGGDWNMNFVFSHNHMESTSQLTNSYFSVGVETTNQSILAKLEINWARLGSRVTSSSIDKKCATLAIAVPQREFSEPLQATRLQHVQAM